jgi:hypothetical protein
MNASRNFSGIPDLLRKSEVCHRLSIAIEKLNAMCDAGLLKVVNIGAAGSDRLTLRITRKSFERYLGSLEAAAGQAKGKRPPQRTRKRT